MLTLTLNADCIRCRDLFCRQVFNLPFFVLHGHRECRESLKRKSHILASFCHRVRISKTMKPAPRRLESPVYPLLDADRHTELHRDVRPTELVTIFFFSFHEILCGFKAISVDKLHWTINNTWSNAAGATLCITWRCTIPPLSHDYHL